MLGTKSIVKTFINTRDKKTPAAVSGSLRTLALAAGAQERSCRRDSERLSSCACDGLQNFHGYRRLCAGVIYLSAPRVLSAYSVKALKHVVS